MSSPRYARVVVTTAARALDRTFTYYIPEELAEQVNLGSIVQVSFGRQTLAGFVVEIYGQLDDEAKKYALKPISRVLHKLPFWGQELLDLAGFMRDYYACTWLESMRAIVPGPVLSQVLKLVGSDKQQIPARKSVAPVPAVCYESLQLTKAQQNALQIINEQRLSGQPVLLHGITGSGKTEVYLHAVQQVLAQGLQAIVLVPELSLTPQAIERYRGRLGDTVGVLHSAMSDAERREQWWAMRQSEHCVALGTRSAVFAPLDKLGLVIIDEEHECSYKQEHAPRYHARQVAFRRAQAHQNCCLVLGSATPSLESYYLAQQGKYRLAELHERPTGQGLPVVHLVDMRQMPKRTLISPPLAEAIKQRIDDNQQVVLLLNRRGFAKYLQCGFCGHVLKCRYCSIALALHKATNTMRCHYCDYTEPAPDCCPQCRNLGFRHGAPGTERLLNEVKALVPQAGVVRMDRDTVGGAHGHERVLEQFASGQAQILVGTRMVAKGLDYPNVTLVGVLRADSELNIPDFRAAVRCFELITQAAGRAGRGKVAGEVFVQTSDPDNLCLQAACHSDFKAVYEAELELRKAAMYPPYCRLVRVLCLGREPLSLETQAQQLAVRLRRLLTSEQVLGPAICPVECVKSVYRRHLVIKGQNIPRITEAVARAYKEMDHPTIELRIDPEPQSFT